MEGSVQAGVQVHRVGFDSLKELIYYWFGSKSGRGRVGVKPGKAGFWARLIAKVYTAVWKNLFFPDDACVWYFPAKRKLRQLLQEQSFDVVITVSLPFTGHLLGLNAFCDSKQNDRTPFWIADIGDPFAFQARSPNNVFLYKRKNQGLERQVLTFADAVVVTSEATLRKYQEQFGASAVSKMKIIPPLFHPPTNRPFANTPASKQSASSPIKIGYFGAFYAPTRAPDAFLQLLAQTFEVRPDLKNRLEIHFYGEIFPEFYAQLQQAPNLYLHGLVSRVEAYAAMQEMDVLLHIGNSTDFQLPSKAVDYLSTGKPILHLSYVESDPFVAFLEASGPMPSGHFFNLKLKKDALDLETLTNWLHWLETEKAGIRHEELSESIAPFLVKNIGRINTCPYCLVKN